MDTGSYRIPSVRLRVDIVIGLGIRELIITAIVAVIAGIIAGTIYMIRGNLVNGAFGVLISIAVCVGCLTRDEYNQSLVSHAANIWRYFRSAKMYPYEYLDEWGGGN